MMKNRKTCNNKKQPQKSGLTERKKQIYAYILAGFIIFWNVASVLGIVAFVRSFVNNDNSSEQRTSVAVAQVLDDNDNVARIERVVRERKMANSNSEPMVLTDFPLVGATVLSDDYTSRDIVSFCSNWGLKFTEDSVYIVDYDVQDEYDMAEDLYSLSVQCNVSVGFAVDVDTIYVDVLYSGMDDTLLRFPSGADLGCFPYSITSSVDIFFDGDGYEMSYGFVIYWYDYSVRSMSWQLETTYIDVSVNGYCEYYGRELAFTYPFGGVPYRSIAESVSLSLGTTPIFVDRSFYNSIYDIANSVGYQSGLSDANTYTFENLLTSVIDAPVRVFTDMFNFEILGVNLSAFFFGLLSVSAVIAIIKLFL